MSLQELKSHIYDVTEPWRLILQNETLDHTNQVGVHYNAYSIGSYYVSTKRVWSAYGLSSHTYAVRESYHLHHT